MKARVGKGNKNISTDFIGILCRKCTNVVFYGCLDGGCHLEVKARAGVGYKTISTNFTGVLLLYYAAALLCRKCTNVFFYGFPDAGGYCRGL